MYKFQTQNKPNNLNINEDTEYGFLKGICIGLTFCTCFCLFIIFILILLRDNINEQDDYKIDIYESDITMSGSGFYEYGYLG